LRLVIGGIDLDQEIAGLDALEIGDPYGEHFARDAARQPRQLGAHIGVIGGLDHGIADPFVEAQRRQRDERERNDDGKQRDREPAPERGGGALRRLRWWGRRCGGRRRWNLLLLTHD
jgi:hypothetical protein